MLSLHLLILLSAPSGAVKSSLCTELRSYKVSIVFASNVAIQLFEAECGCAPSVRLITKLGHDNISSYFQETFIDVVIISIDRLVKAFANMLQSKFADNCHHNFYRAILVFIIGRHSVRIPDGIRVIYCRLFRSKLLGIVNSFLANLDHQDNLVDENNASISEYNRRSL